MFNTVNTASPLNITLVIGKLWVTVGVGVTSGTIVITEYAWTPIQATTEDVGVTVTVGVAVGTTVGVNDAVGLTVGVIVCVIVGVTEGVGSGQVPTLNTVFENDGHGSVGGIGPYNTHSPPSPSDRHQVVPLKYIIDSVIKFW